jgi:hypothetical protein
MAAAVANNWLARTSSGSQLGRKNGFLHFSGIALIAGRCSDRLASLADDFDPVTVVKLPPERRSGQVGLPFIKQVTGLANSGTRITALALSDVQSRRSGVTATEQTSTKAVNISPTPI